MSTSGRIFDIQHFSIHDGPGIRTTVFFKGCNMRCRWCHNPESQSGEKEILFYQNKCTACGRCKDVGREDTDFFCYHDARVISGRDYTTDELFAEIVKDRAYYEASGGGVTFSGGECMLQIDFLCEIAKKCKESGISVAIDTAGNVPYAYFERVLPYTDCFLYDVKSMDRETHLSYTGVDHTLLLQNLKKLLATNVAVWLRLPLILGVNDTESHARALRAFLDESGEPERIEFLPYHTLGEHKYSALGRRADAFLAPSEATVKSLEAIVTRSP